jgi:hypothetical protein
MEARFHVRVVVSGLRPEELVERIARIATDHVAQCSEGVVPAVLAEEIVERLAKQDALLFLDLSDEES